MEAAGHGWRITDNLLWTWQKMVFILSLLLMMYEEAHDGD